MSGNLKLRAWIEIIRPANLFTVPGDPLAGFLLAASLAKPAELATAIFPALAALCLYIGGLIGNDVADAAEDGRDRPGRPIPSGRIARRAAFAASAAWAGLGILVVIPAGFPAFGLACLTQLAVMIYNGWLKRYTIPGALAMGACRGLSFLMGTAAACPRLLDSSPVLAAAGGITLYIAGVTWIADRETIAERVGPRRWVPFLVLAIAMPLISLLTHKLVPSFLAFGALAILWAFFQAWRIRGIPSPPVLGSAIGGLIRGLLLIQAAFCALAGRTGMIVALCLLAAWPASKALAKRFPAT
jgi:4-hydroxybenzoate polyprenyltransferase